MRILITGGIGFVGGRLSKALSQEHEIVISSRRNISNDILALHGATSSVLHHDLLDSDKWPGEIEVVIHLASLNEIDCLKYPSAAIAINIDHSRIILENAIKKGVSRFIFFSTAHVYGNQLAGIIDEQYPLAPIHPYSITHRAAEDFVIAANRTGGIEACVIRLSNSFGAPVLPDVNRWSLLANDLSRQAVVSRKLTLHSDGSQRRDFISLTDVCGAIQALLGRSPQMPEILNLCSGVTMSVGEMAEKIASCYDALFGEKLLIEKSSPAS